MICAYCQSEWFPARFHPGCCGECGGPRLRSAPQVGDAMDRSTVPHMLTLCGEPVEVDWTRPGGVIHLPPGGTAEAVCPEVDGKTMREVLSETFPYQTWAAMNYSLLKWRIG